MLHGDDFRPSEAGLHLQLPEACLAHRRFLGGCGKCWQRKEERGRGQSK
jgi:hypothetical protein